MASGHACRSGGREIAYYDREGAQIRRLGRIVEEKTWDLRPPDGRSHPQKIDGGWCKRLLVNNRCLDGDGVRRVGHEKARFGDGQLRVEHEGVINVDASRHPHEAQVNVIHF